MNPDAQALNVPTESGQNTRATLELLYNISRELVTALELNTVLKRVLELSTRYVGAISGTLIVLDDAGQPVESALWLSGRFIDQTTDQLRVTFERGLAGWAARKRQAVLIPDTSQDERWLRRPDDNRDRTGPKSAVSTPIEVQNRPVGVMTLVHPQVGFFSTDHLALVQAIADQAGIAILNARLYAESQRQARVMTAIAESAASITASLDPAEVLRTILGQASHALQAEVVALARIDPVSGELVFQAARGANSQHMAGMRLQMGQGVSGQVAQEGRGLVVNDAANDEMFDQTLNERMGYVIRAIACAPIRWQGQVIGIIEAINPEAGRFGPDALVVLNGIGSLAGTAIRHAELFERLEAAHQRYHELFDDSIDPILLTDWRGDLQEANRQAVLALGMEAEEARRLNIAALNIIDSDRVGVGFQHLRSGQTVTYETTLSFDRKQETPVQVYARQVQIDETTYLQWILRDISERKKLDSLRDDLISMIYHDLRSPLANIVSSLELLTALLPEDIDPGLNGMLSVAMRSTERIQRLTNSLLDINRLEAGHPVGNRQPAWPNQLATDALEAVLPLAAVKNVSLSCRLAETLPAVQVDVDMIRRVMINLLENAVKYTPTGGQAWIDGRSSAEEVEIFVQDTGPGIPPDERERIFDKFTRLKAKDGPPGPRVSGFGLGLAFCRLAVAGHGGRIWVESGPEGGSSFHFTLPLA
jgi:PAS domain S-box-containing protein